MDKRLLEQFDKELGWGRRDFLPPIGILKAEFNEAGAADCMQARPLLPKACFDSLMSVTKFNPCNGCSTWQQIGPECQCFQQYHTAFRAAKAKVAAGERRQNELHTRVIERCTECGLRVRGPNHSTGKHHTERVAALAKR